jgi:hypothetical protein
MNFDGVLSRAVPGLDVSPDGKMVAISIQITSPGRGISIMVNPFDDAGSAQPITVIAQLQHFSGIVVFQCEVFRSDIARSGPASTPRQSSFSLIAP